MKLAIIGSRELTKIEIDRYVPAEVTEIVSGGAKGVDTLARDFSQRKGLPLTEFLPQYALYGRAAPIKRNYEMVNYADKILVFWNGSSRGTLSVIQYAKATQKPCQVILCQ